MRPYKALTPLLLGALAVGCNDLDVTNPSQRTTDTFYRNESDALAAVNATYHGLQELGAFGRWQTFADDARSDVATSRSPWTDLANFTRTILSSYNFEVNIHLWEHNYRTIFAANQVIANVPNVQMNEERKARFIAEAKFIRALSYYNLVTFFGGPNGIPLVLEPSDAEDRPASSPTADVWARIEQDLTEARAVLPPSYSGADIGRATSGAATAMLAKAHLQQREWGEAATLFGEVVGSGQYELVASFGDNFRADRDNNAESIFEVQFTEIAQLSQGSAGYSGPKLYGPCGPAFCDQNPTRWYFEQFFAENPAVPDPRLDFTIFYNKPGGMDVFGEPFAERYADRLDALFVKKYTQYYSRQDEIFDNPTNFKVLRLGGVLLLHAEALNESGNPGAAKGFVDQVRARVGLGALPPGLNQAQMRDRIEHEQLMELGFEAERFRYLQRQNLLTAEFLPTLKARDPDFDVFEPARSTLLPIPNSETDLNAGVEQNPGY